MNKPLRFTLVEKYGDRWGPALITRGRFRRRDAEKSKVDELEKWEDEGGDVHVLTNEII